MKKDLWEKAIEYHGHQCGGLAYGFRMGEEALNIFGNHTEIHCKIPSKNCIMDGITTVTGASFENNRMTLDSSLKNYLFFVPDDEEGWEIGIRERDFPGGNDPVQAILACGRDFLFTLTPVDMD